MYSFYAITENTNDKSLTEDFVDNQISHLQLYIFPKALPLTSQDSQIFFLLQNLFKVQFSKCTCLELKTTKAFQKLDGTY